MSGDIRIHYVDSTLRLTSLANVIAATWFDAPSLDQMRVVGDATDRMRRRCTQGMAFVNLIVDGVPKFSKEVADEAARQSRLATDRDIATAHVILVSGLTGSAVRAFMATVVLVSRPKEPAKVFGDIATAAKWLMPLLAKAPRCDFTGDTLVSFMEQAVER